MACSAFAEPVFITNTSVSAVDSETASKIFQARTNAYTDGTSFVIGTLSFSSDATDAMYEALIGKSAKRIERVWTKKQFSGKGVVPTEFETSEELVNWVADTKGAIAIVDSADTNSKVKTIR